MNVTFVRLMVGGRVRKCGYDQATVLRRGQQYKVTIGCNDNRLSALNFLVRGILISYSFSSSLSTYMFIYLST